MEQKKNYTLPIVMMFFLFAMISFVTGLANPMGVILKNQFDVPNWMSQLGNAANFIAYAFMGLPAGLMLQRIGYKKTALAAVAVGFVGVGIQFLAGLAGGSGFAVYLAGAFVSGFSMCMLNTVVNPMLNTLGGGGIVPSATMVDIFPMRDGGVNGKTATDFYTKLAASTLEYDEVHPFMDRDPRFYRTFGFPGFEWTFSGNPMAEGKNMNPYQGSAYELWNYIWYLDKSLVGDHTSSNTYAADNLLDKGKGLYLTKRSTGDVYAYDYIDVANGGQGFRYSQASYMEIRYAEVLLNLAEVAAGAGRMDRAVELLGQIRKRAGYVEANNYGLTPAASSDQATCMAQVLYERQIELAYEGKRFDDMRRWLLFDGGVNFASIPGAPQTWILTGWGGNTCTWLGYKPLNGKRRENLEFQVKSTVNDGVGGKEWKSWDDMPDPIAKFVFEHGTFNPATGEYDAWTKGKTWNDYRSWRTGFRVQLNKLNVKNGKLDEALTKLKENFYEPYLQRKLKRGDGLTPDQTLDGMYVTFLPRYYLLGLTSNAQTKNPTLLQTIGWEDYNGGAGTFDPFASTATAE